MIDKETLQAQLADIKAQADQLRAKAEATASELQGEAMRQVDRLKALQQEAQGQFADLLSTGEAKLNEVRGTVEGLVGDVSNTLKSITSRFK